MMKCEIVLENGERKVFYLHNDELRKLEHEVKEQNEYQQAHGMSSDYKMPDAILWMMRESLRKLKDPARNMKPQ